MLQHFPAVGTFPGLRHPGTMHDGRESNRASAASIAALSSAGGGAVLGAVSLADGGGGDKPPRVADRDRVRPNITTTDNKSLLEHPFSDTSGGSDCESFKQTMHLCSFQIWFFVGTIMIQFLQM